MSNVIYQNTMFNEEIKNKFLKQFETGTALTYKRVFVKNASIEEYFNKDIYNFNLAELKKVMFNLNPPTINSAKHYGGILLSYLSWAIEQGLRTNNINPLKTMEQNWFLQFVNNSIELYITDVELQRIEDYCVNAQDAVIFRLLFEGVQGEGCAELINLKREDVDFENNVLHLQDADGSTRELNVSSRCISLIEEALEQDEYIKLNGEMEEIKNIRPYTDLVNNNYVLRSSITKTDSYKAIHKHTIYRRIKTIKDLYDSPYLTVKNIAKSGMIWLGKNFLESDGKLEKEQYLIIAERFKIANWWTIKDYVNIEQIKKMYYV